MATWFVKNNAIVATPDDANDGRDPIGFALSSATYDDTGNAEGEHHLSSTGAFSGYTHQSGDLIYLSGGAGITTGLYEIDSKVDDDAILLTNSAGSDSSGDVTSSDGPFATISHSVNEGGSGNGNLAAGDEIRICNDATFSIDTQVDVDQAIQHVAFLGATARGVVDGTRATIQASASINRTVYFGNGANVTGWYIAYIVWDGNNQATNNVEFGAWTDPAGSFVYDCVLKGGTFTHSKGRHTRFVNCDFHDGNGAGYAYDREDSTSFIFCSFRDLSNPVLRDNASANQAHFFGCLIYDVASVGTYLDNNSTMANCVVHGCSNDGIKILAGGYVVIYNCSFVANGGYGINDQGAQWHSIDNNHYHNNTSGPINGNGTTINTADINTTEKYGKNNQTGDPKFASTTDGSEDFTPQSGSPLINNGLDAGVS